MNQLAMFAETPTAPYSNPSTSKEAASSVRGRINDLQEQVLAFLQRRGVVGATDEEMQRGIPMLANTQRPRRRELVLDGLVQDSEKRRETSTGKAAIVWVAA